MCQVPVSLRSVQGGQKEELSDDCIITPFLWAWSCLYLRSQALYCFCLYPLLSAIGTTLCRGSRISLDSSSKSACFLPHQREGVCSRLT